MQEPNICPVPLELRVKQMVSFGDGVSASEAINWSNAKLEQRLIPPGIAAEHRLSSVLYPHW